MSDQQRPVYLDDQGNPITSAPVYLDDSGEPVAESEGIGKKILRFFGGEGMSEGQRRYIEEANKELNAGGPLAAAKEGVKQAAFQAVGGPLLKAGARPITGVARRMYQSALKPTKAVLDDMAGGADDATKIRQLVDTGLDEGVSVTRGGLGKAQRTIEGIDTQISDAISGSTATVGKRDVLRRIAGPVSRFKDQVTPMDDLRQIGAVGREFNATRAAQIPVQQAQKMKQGTYRALAGKFGGEVKSASAEAQKSLARGLKEEISTAVPGVGALNARESGLLALQDALEGAMRRTGNSNMLSLNDIIAGTHNPGWLAATLAMRAPAMSTAARGVHQAGRAVGAGAANPSLSLLQLLMPSHEQD
jgi:hypothetical protein